MLALVLVVSFTGACSGADDALAPEATLGKMRGSEATFRPLMRRWVLGTDEERAGLGRELDAFVQKYPRDPLVRLAKVLLALNALAVGDLERAVRLVEGGGIDDATSPLFGPPGVTRDLGTLVLGSVERRQGDYDEALEHLSPLLNKMLDSFATVMLDEELVLAALGGRRYAEAIVYMEAWRQEAQPGTEREIEQRLKELLAAIPAAELMRALDERAAARRLRSNLDMAQLIAQQLAVIVVGARDTRLARELLTKYGALLGDYGEAVARLAVVLTKGRVLAKTVGLLLALRTPGMRRRSADVASGMSFGLELPGSGARLVVREAGADEGDVRAALTELASEGAAVVVGGVDPDQTPALATFARDNALPVLLMTPDESGVASTSTFSFEIGVDPTETVGQLADAMGGGKLAGIGPSLGEGRAAALGLALERPCIPSPRAELESSGVTGVVVYDGAACGAALADILATTRRIGIGLGVPDVGDRPASSWWLEAGVFPVDPKSADGRLRAWLDAGRAPPSWWSALGRDAAVLAWAAVRDLQETTTDMSEVRARRLEATSALAAAADELWTTQARGFAGQQRLARRITLRGGR